VSDYLLFHTPQHQMLILLGAIGIDDVIEQEGMKRQQVKYTKQ